MGVYWILKHFPIFLNNKSAPGMTKRKCIAMVSIRSCPNKLANGLLVRKRNFSKVINNNKSAKLFIYDCKKHWERRSAKRFVNADDCECEMISPKKVFLNLMYCVDQPPAVIFRFTIFCSKYLLFRNFVCFKNLLIRNFSPKLMFRIFSNFQIKNI